MPDAHPEKAAAEQALEADRSIAQVCRETGLSARTVRYYEELGLLPGVRRHAAGRGGRRLYGPDEIERLRFIQRLKALGLTLAEIKDLNAIHGIAGSTSAMLERLGAVLDGHLDDLDRRIRELSDLRDEMSKYRDHVDARRDALGRASHGES